MSDPAHRALGREGDFDSLLGRVHAIGREVLAAHAGDVDRDARFPREAFDALPAGQAPAAPTSRGTSAAWG